MDEYITKDRLIRKNNPSYRSHSAIKKLLKHYMNTIYNDETAVVLEKLLVFPEDKELKNKIINSLLSMKEEYEIVYDKYSDRIHNLIVDDLKNV